MGFKNRSDRFVIGGHFDFSSAISNLHQLKLNLFHINPWLLVTKAIYFKRFWDLIDEFNISKLLYPRPEKNPLGVTEFQDGGFCICFLYQFS